MFVGPWTMNHAYPAIKTLLIRFDTVSPEMFFAFFTIASGSFHADLAIICRCVISYPELVVVNSTQALPFSTYQHKHYHHYDQSHCKSAHDVMANRARESKTAHTSRGIDRE